MSADFASDYMLVRGGGRATLYDYKLRRVLNLNEQTHSFGNDSLYANADFRMVERYNRRMLRAVVAKIGKADALADAYWDESELHVVDPRDPAVAAQRQAAPDGAVRFIYKNAEVASFATSDQNLSPEERTGLRRLLMETSNLHPVAIAALIETGRVPKRLSFALPPARKKGAEVWVLQSASRLTTAYPLTSAYTAEPLTKRQALSEAGVLPVMLEAGRGSKGLRTPAQYHAAIGDALARKAGLQAALLGLEGSEQYGERAFDCSGGQAGCHSLKEIFTEGQNDARVGVVVRALGAGQTDRAKALAAMRGLRRDDVTNGYVIDDFAGNMMVEEGNHRDALPLIANAVRGNPYVAGYYKDMGDLFRTSFDSASAWICYDLGRVLPGGASAPVIDNINQYETKLASDFPQFF
jgi:hypothetical protein